MSIDRSGVAIDQRTVVLSNGHSIVVTRFRVGQVKFALHVGSSDPPGGTGIVDKRSGPAVSAAERPLLLAAFNGGFKQSAQTGGFEINQRVLAPLQPGLASFVIDASGAAHVGVWTADVPVAGERVASVRQNLPPLIITARASPNIMNISAWGATLGGAAVIARSALGQDAQGNLLYAAGMQALPVDLADALLTAGATNAMELDINPEWVQIDVAPTAGGVLQADIPGQQRPPNQYLMGWTRDFVTVCARTNSS